MLFFYLQTQLISNQYQKVIVVEGDVTTDLSQLVVRKSFPKRSVFQGDYSHGCTQVLLHPTEGYFLGMNDIAYLYGLLRQYNYTLDTELTKTTLQTKVIDPSKFLFMIAYWELLMYL